MILHLLKWGIIFQVLLILYQTHAHPLAREELLKKEKLTHTSGLQDQEETLRLAKYWLLQGDYSRAESLLWRGSFSPSFTPIKKRYLAFIENIKKDYRNSLEYLHRIRRFSLSDYRLCPLVIENSLREQDFKMLTSQQRKNFLNFIFKCQGINGIQETSWSEFLFYLKEKLSVTSETKRPSRAFKFYPKNTREMLRMAKILLYMGDDEGVMELIDNFPTSLKNQRLSEEIMTLARLRQKKLPLESAFVKSDYFPQSIPLLSIALYSALKKGEISQAQKLWEQLLQRKPHSSFLKENALILSSREKTTPQRLEKVAVTQNLKSLGLAERETLLAHYLLGGNFNALAHEKLQKARYYQGGKYSLSLDRLFLQYALQENEQLVALKHAKKLCFASKFHYCGLYYDLKQILKNQQASQPPFIKKETLKLASDYSQEELEEMDELFWSL